MEEKTIVPPESESAFGASPPKLDIGRAYSARDTAAILGIAPSVLNERVRQGLMAPVFPTGDRIYSGYAIAKLLGWPLSDDPRDYMPGKDALDEGKAKPPPRRRRPVVVS